MIRLVCQSRRQVATRCWVDGTGANFRYVISLVPSGVRSTAVWERQIVDIFRSIKVLADLLPARAVEAFGMGFVAFRQLSFCFLNG